jgi:hypothetical protein
MLRDDVVEAVGAGRFTVHAIATIDQGIEVLTGRKAGKLGRNGRYPANSINRLVQDRVHKLAALRRQFARAKPNGKANGKDSGKDDAEGNP